MTNNYQPFTDWDSSSNDDIEIMLNNIRNSIVPQLYFITQNRYQDNDEMNNILYLTQQTDGELKRNDTIRVNIEPIAETKLENFDLCAICQSDIVTDELKTTLKTCKHHFHSECITECAKYKKSCPVCRCENID